MRNNKQSLTKCRKRRSRNLKKRFLQKLINLNKISKNSRKTRFTMNRSWYNKNQILLELQPNKNKILIIPNNKFNQNKIIKKGLQGYKKKPH